MAEFDFDAARRWARFDPQKTLARRADDELPFVDASRIGGQGLLLDTCVYIDVLQRRAPERVKRLLTTRLSNHSGVVLAELTHLFGRLDPRDLPAQ